MTIDEMTTIRERLARIETTLEHIAARLDCAQKEKGSGSIVLPVALVVGIMELVVQLGTRVLG